MDQLENINRDKFSRVIYDDSNIGSRTIAFMFFLYYKYNVLTFYDYNDLSMESFEKKNTVICGINNFEIIINILNSSDKCLLITGSTIKYIDSNYEELKILNVSIECKNIWKYFFNDKIPQVIIDTDILIKNDPIMPEYIIQPNFTLWEKVIFSNYTNYSYNIFINKYHMGATYIVQELNNEYFIFLYYIFDDNIVENKGIPLVDCICTRKNVNNNVTKFQILSENFNALMIAKELSIVLSIDDASILNIDGIHYYIPLLEPINLDIISLLLCGENNFFIYKTKKYEYTLFNVNNVNELWLKEKCLNLIKKKCNTIFIIFRVIKNSDENTQIYKYTMIYNEKIGKKLADYELFFGLTIYNILEFDSTKEINEIFC